MACFGSIPTGGGHAFAEAKRHQLMVGWVELHFIDPSSLTVMGVKHGRVSVGRFSPANDFAGTSAYAKAGKSLLVNFASRHFDCIDQRLI